ncbi:MAG: 16S rRNA (adenine(1518)-N(6)/adenine(1519)-N(6))-dimethyltransferase RsmA [Lachnospiraceae bacterium]|nr:16S rRNA (adenine(1518)-N(6)/adenine(1519)-N(6))-dimethyltransferase RsmA [Lachnospiraceae bacterium]
MNELSIRVRTLKIINGYDFLVKKKYGQNFLVKEEVFEKIVSAAGITGEDVVLEIGPGIGALTGYLARNAKSVIAVEIDKNLIPILEETLADHDNIEIINRDILKVDIDELVRERGIDRPLKVVANLPYYITTPIIMELLKASVKFTGMTFMVQKEVADRMQAGPRTKAYGALTLAVQYYGDVSVAAEVPPGAFIPEPEVESAVVHISMPRANPIEVRNEELLFKLIRASFNQRRKTLYNGIKNYPELNYSKEVITGNIEKLGHGPMVRGEELTLEEFAFLADYFDMESAL